MKINKLLILLLLVCGMFAACKNAESADNSTKDANNSINKSADNVADGDKSASPTPSKKKGDEIPKFKKGENYKSVREKLIKAGWKPFKSPEADKCYGDDERCKDYPEMESCAGTGLGNCRYLWKKDGKTLRIFTVGESPVYDGQEIQKDEKSAEPDGISGKYVYRYKHDSGYDEFVYELKANGTATFKSVREGGDGRDLTGTWDESEGIISTVFKNEEGITEVIEFSLEKGNLKQLTDPNANENYKGFIGTVFNEETIDKLNY